ncbi:hypothetical protein Q8A73_011018 [Channa argus]|nr:hypothetical protein Q8A73_011018 [Channa argus]
MMEVLLKKGMTRRKRRVRRRRRQKQFENPFSRLFMFVVLEPHCASLQTHRAFAELNGAHLLALSCATVPTSQDLSLCLFLSNSHSLFTFAFLHCDSHQNNITPAPREADCQAIYSK